MENAKESFRFENGYYSYSKKYDGVSGVAFAFDKLDAAKMLGEKIESEQLVSEYLLVSECNDSSQKIHAIISLARLGGERALSRIIELTSDHDDDVRAMAIDCLCSFPAERKVLDTLMKLLKEKDLAVRTASAAALGRIGNNEAVPVLRSELSRSLSSRRLWKEGGKFHRNELAEHVINLFHSLLKLGDSSVIPEIAPLLLHPETLIAEGAADLLFHYKTRDEVILGSALRYIRKRRDLRIMNNLYDVPPGSGDMQYLRAALYSKNRCMRSQAAKHLGETKKIGGQKILVEYLEKGSDPEILLFILERQSLRFFQVDLRIYILREALAHRWPTVRFRAARQLQQLPPWEGRKLAEEALRNEPDSLITKALKAFISWADCETDKQECATGSTICQKDCTARIPASQSDRTTNIPKVHFDSRCLQVEQRDAQEKSPLKLRCSFCGIDQSQVDRLIIKHQESKLITAPNVGICNFCIENLNEIVKRRPLIPPDTVEKFKGTCSFCDRQIYYSGSLLTGPEVRICIECLELCNKVLNDDSGDDMAGAKDSTDGSAVEDA